MIVIISGSLYFFEKLVLCEKFLVNVLCPWVNNGRQIIAGESWVAYGPKIMEFYT